MGRKFQKINEGAYDFYSKLKGKNDTEKIVDYYLDKISKFGINSLTSKEKEIFNLANAGDLKDLTIYKRNRITGDIELDNLGNPVVDPASDNLIPGLPFLTSKGKGVESKYVIQARCYWNLDEEGKTYYVFFTIPKTEENPFGLVAYKTLSSSGKSAMGIFLKTIPNGDKDPDDFWETLEKKYDKYVILDQNTLDIFKKFETEFHSDKKVKNIVELMPMYDVLKKFPAK